jgi:hypothetical protein
VIECVPTVKALLMNVAVVPPARVTAGLKGVAPSRNVTVPLGVGLPEAVRLAAKVTFCPKVEGLRELDKASDVGLGATVWDSNAAKGERELTLAQTI